MKRINFNIKDRKFLITTLSLVMVCVFTLSIAYAALNAVLTIQGNAEVVASTWDIHLDNPRVTVGSATTNLPVIKTSSTLEFSTTLNMPGDFYEFTVDVVNDGTIDAMIANVVKNPELTVEQAKFLKYEVSYKNGESITTKQLLSKDTTMPIKVRIEYRKDLNNADLPTGQIVLDLSLTLEYIQSDGTGSNVTNNGQVRPVANGDINEIGTIVTIGSEQFYTIGTDGDNLKLLSMYNLYVSGYYYYGSYPEPDIFVDYGSDATGMQDENMFGYFFDGHTFSNNKRDGVCKFSSDEQKGVKYNSYNGSIVETYVNNYKTLLESKFEVDIVEARLITYDELVNKDTFNCVDHNKCTNNSYPWIYSTSYWTGTGAFDNKIWTMTGGTGSFSQKIYRSNDKHGVRPVIVISKDYFN